MNFVSRLLAAAATALVTLSAQAFPIAPPGTEGFSVVVSATGPVIARYEGNSAAFSNNLFLNGTFIFNNQTSLVGSTVDLGSFAAGTELIFRLQVTNTSQNYFTGSASRNPDGQAHARVQDNFETGRTLVSFEDLFNGPFNFNDLSFSFTNTRSEVMAPVPEPETYAMLLAGLAALGVWSRRRKSA
ncbi:MAG: PEP-CTERM sorting domain-containing protein [Caldimonas sp.]